LSQGSVTLSILEKMVDEYIERERRKTTQSVSKPGTKRLR
jgi:hypothetical protein